MRRSSPFESLKELAEYMLLGRKSPIAEKEDFRMINP
jgi:hypothetical protein